MLASVLKHIMSHYWNYESFFKDPPILKSIVSDVINMVDDEFQVGHMGGKGHMAPGDLILK